jgi:hypothetical protein
VNTFDTHAVVLADTSGTICSWSTELDGAAANIPVLCADGRVTRFPGRLVLLQDARERVVGALAIFAPPERGAEGLPGGQRASACPYGARTGPPLFDL